MTSVFSIIRLVVWAFMWRMKFPFILSTTTSTVELSNVVWLLSNTWIVNCSGLPSNPSSAVTLLFIYHLVLASPSKAITLTVLLPFLRYTATVRSAMNSIWFSPSVISVVACVCSRDSLPSASCCSRPVELRLIQWNPVFVNVYVHVAICDGRICIHQYHRFDRKHTLSSLAWFQRLRIFMVLNTSHPHKPWDPSHTRHFLILGGNWACWVVNVLPLLPWSLL